jgi:DNA-binding NarL/FixJ family response regulator
MTAGRRSPILRRMLRVSGPIARAIPVVVAARHECLRAALWQLLDGEPGVEPLAAASDLAGMLRLLSRLTPEVLIVAEPLLGDAGLRRRATVAVATPAVAYVVVGMHDHPGHAQRVRDAGAADYVLLDEATERLVVSVAEAAGRSAPLPDPRRRAGRRAVSVVPAPGAESIVRVPPASSTRSRMPTSPKPAELVDGSKP